MNDLTFDSLGLIAPILQAVAEQGYEHPTPIQCASIPSLLEGRDLLGCAQTGTGKTAAFALPIIQYIAGKPLKSAPRSVRVLIVAPTRELAAQINQSFTEYSRHTKLSHACIFGGVGQGPQEKALAQGVDVLVATPGRLLDLHNQGKLRLNAIEIFVLDEADRMLDMGFIHDVKKIIALVPKERQTLLFSATMPSSIADLAKTLLRKPLRVDISPEAPTVELIEQSVIFADKNDKRHMLAALIEGDNVQRALVFTRTKHGADRLVKSLEKTGISSAAIHANKSQNNRIRTLEDFRAGRIRVLVATDLAARGIDVDGITHVFNYELPNEPETYVHRIGRTARAGAQGIAIALCESEEKPFLRDIERLIGKKLPTASGANVDEAFKIAAAARAEEAKNPPEPDRERRRNDGLRGRSMQKSSPRTGGASASGGSGGSSRGGATRASGAGGSERGGGFFRGLGSSPSRASSSREASPRPAGRDAPRDAASRGRGSGSTRSGSAQPPVGRRAQAQARAGEREREVPRRSPTKNNTGRPSASREDAHSNHDAIRNAIRDIARGQDDFLMTPRAKPDTAGKTGKNGNPQDKA
jgi:ATP-dependent RNA helicase RhlE